MLKSTLTHLSSLLLFSQPALSQADTTKHALPSSDHTLVKQLLTEDLGKRRFHFSQVVKSASGHKVLKFDSTNTAHKTIQLAIEQAIKESSATLNKRNSPTKKLRRINEASRHFEDLLLEKINAHPKITCSIPKNAQGKPQRSGYPDIKIEHHPSKTTFYLDPKLYEQKSRRSSLRTFYFEPKVRTMKIQDDAVHLLLGISHDGADGDWTFLSWELVDLSTFKVRLKAEFQASNKDLYRKNNIISSGK